MINPFKELYLTRRDAVFAAGSFLIAGAIVYMGDRDRLAENFNQRTSYHHSHTPDIRPAMDAIQDGIDHARKTPVRNKVIVNDPFLFIG